MLPGTVMRFATVGVVNSAIDVVLFWALHAPLGIVAANFLSTSAGMTFSFLANGRHTFRASRVTARQALLFLAINGLTMWVLQPLLIHTAYDVASAPLMLAKVVALGGGAVANFVLYRYVVWRDDAARAGVRPTPRPADLVAARGAARR